MAKNTNPVLDLFRENFDSYDKWASVMSARFDIAECLYRHGAEVPGEWEFSPSMALHPGDTLDVENETIFAADIDLLMQQGHYSNLVHAGNVLARYAAQLELSGHSY